MTKYLRFINIILEVNVFYYSLLLLTFGAAMISYTIGTILAIVSIPFAILVPLTNVVTLIIFLAKWRNIKRHGFVSLSLLYSFFAGIIYNLIISGAGGTTGDFAYSYGGTLRQIVIPIIGLCITGYTLFYFSKNERDGSALNPQLQK